VSFKKAKKSKKAPGNKKVGFRPLSLSDTYNSILAGIGKKASRAGHGSWQERFAA
jgi:hypothetical protein